jgi:hypothetical protein
MRLDGLNKLWDAESSKRSILGHMTFENGVLTLGAGTRLAKVGAALDEARFAALLAAAHGRPITASALRHVQLALEKKQDGDVTLALIHLALSGVAKLRDPKEDAHRMFLADALMRQGVQPLVIVKGLGFDAPLPDGALGKYNRDQPRVPAGNPDGGQSTSEDWSGAVSGSPSPRPRDIPVADASAKPGHEVRTDGAAETAIQVATLPAVSPSGAADNPIDEAADQSGFHNAVRDTFADDLASAGNTVIKEVPLTLQSDPPVTAVIDIIFRTPEGEVYAIDVKTGDNSQFTPNQQIVYPHVEIGGLVASDDPRISVLAFTQHVPLPPIPIVVLYTHGPGKPMLTYPMGQFMQK